MQSRKQSIFLGALVAFVFGLSILGASQANASSSSPSRSSQFQQQSTNPLSGSPAIKVHSGAMFPNGFRKVRINDVIDYMNTNRPQGLHWNIQVTHMHYDVHLMTMGQFNSMTQTQPFTIPDNEEVFVVTIHDKNIVASYPGATPRITYVSYLVYDETTGNFLLSEA